MKSLLIFVGITAVGAVFTALLVWDALRRERELSDGIFETMADDRTLALQSRADDLMKSAVFQTALDVLTTCALSRCLALPLQAPRFLVVFSP